jgi:hypothetical protein
VWSSLTPLRAKPLLSLPGRSGNARRGPAKSIVLASSANPYGAFVRSASFVN